jgi:hypothetical protein
MGMRQVHGRISTGYTKTQYGHYIVPGDKATRFELRIWNTMVVGGWNAKRRLRLGIMINTISRGRRRGEQV